jgi:hypothetical protein
MRSIWLVFLTLSLAACSSNPHTLFVSPSAITGPIYGLKRQSLDGAIAYLGLPDSEAKLEGGQRVVIWKNEGAKSLGNVDNSVSDINGNRVATPAPYCMITATIGGSNEIKSIRIDANSAFYCPRGKEPALLRGSL